MSLDEFITQAKKMWDQGRCFPQRAYVKEPGWAELYVRYSRRYINGETYRSLELAKLEARRPGKGTFKRLVSRLRREYPELLLYVECVNAPEFRPGLIRLGFKKREEEDMEDYYLLPDRSPAIKEV